MRSLILPAVASLALAAGALAGCGRAPIVGRAAASDTLYVAVAVGLTSPERYVNVFHGVQLALDGLNRSRPAGSPALAMRRAPADARSHLDVAVAFRDDPRVIGVVGHTESDPSIDASVVYDDRGNGGKRALVAISPTASGTMVTRVSEWMFRVCPPVAQQAQALASYAVDSLGLRRIGVVYRNDVWGKDFIRAFDAEVARRGASVLGYDPFVEEIPEFDAYARRLAVRRADGVIIGGNGSDALRVLRALRTADASVATLAVNPPTGMQAAADAQLLDAMRYLTLYAPERPATAASEPFAREFATRHGAQPDQWGALGYDAAMLIGRAVHEVGGDRRKVRDAIAAVGRGRPAHVGVSGVIRFDATGDPERKQMAVLGGRS